MRPSSSDLFEPWRSANARLVKLSSVSFGPSTGPDWSVSVMVEDLVRPDARRCQNDEPSFWSAPGRR